MASTRGVLQGREKASGRSGLIFQERSENRCCLVLRGADVSEARGTRRQIAPCPHPAAASFEAPVALTTRENASCAFTRS